MMNIHSFGLVVHINTFESYNAKNHLIKQNDEQNEQKSIQSSKREGVTYQRIGH